MPQPLYPRYELRGAPRARGRMYGEQARELIGALVEEHFAFLEFSAAHIVGAALSRTQILRVSDAYLPACERFAPDLVDEVRGVAESSGVSFRELFSLNAFIDLADMVRPETAANYFSTHWAAERSNVKHETASVKHPSQVNSNRAGGCTSFGAMPPATRDGNVYLGQTFDTKAVFEPYVCALEIADFRREVPPERLYENRTVVATFAGMVGCAGINRAGVGVVINHLHTYDARPGVPFTFAVRKILQASSAAEALEILARSAPASGIHYLVGDENALRGAETSATRFEILHPRHGILAHANHCAAPLVQEIEVEPSAYSLCRGERAAELLAAHAGQIDAHTLAEIACDHVGAEDTICSHAEVDSVASARAAWLRQDPALMRADATPRLRQYKTNFAVILEPKERAMELYVGSPCENRVHRTEV